MSSMSYTSGIDTISGNSALESKESPLGDNVGGVNSWNRTLHLVTLRQTCLWNPNPNTCS
jgi:hypothetical protein